MFVLQVFVLLTDVMSLANGPTQLVPTSHLSGRRPNGQHNPTFQGREVVSMLGRAGDAYCFNNDIWHRGAPNWSDQVRLLGGTTYSQRRISQKLFPHVDYHMPAHVFEGASPRLQRFLGRHDKGPYG